MLTGLTKTSNMVRITCQTPGCQHCHFQPLAYCCQHLAESTTLPTYSLTKLLALLQTYNTCHLWHRKIHIKDSQTGSCRYRFSFKAECIMCVLFGLDFISRKKHKAINTTKEQISIDVCSREQQISDKVIDLGFPIYSLWPVTSVTYNGSYTVCYVR